MQAFNYRLTLTDVPENRLPFSQPAGYDEADYELLLRYFEAGNEIRPFSLHRMPNLKTDSNGAAIVSTDLAGANWDYAEASYAERELILQEHRDYIEGLLWTVQNHPRIPQSVRNSYASWGYAKDEFLENDNFPTQIYVREARRMVSDYIVTELDARRLRIADDPIAIASYPLDSHFTGVHVGDDGTVTGEGSFYYPAGGPFFVSYQSIVPRQGEVTNLAVTSAISASHAAYGAVRMEPVYMMMGHSAGAAASLAIDNQVAMQEVDYSQLKTLLVNEGQVLTLPHWAEPREIYTADTLPGVVVDDFDATFTGDNHWGVSYWPWVDGMYSNDLKAAKGDWTATFETPLSGAYEVRVLFPSHAGNATNVPVTVHHAGGWTSYAVDQTTAGNYVSLGPFTFGASAKVVLDNTGTDGVVIADAVQFLPIL